MRMRVEGIADGWATGQGPEIVDVEVTTLDYPGDGSGALPHGWTGHRVVFRLADGDAVQVELTTRYGARLRLLPWSVGKSNERNRRERQGFPGSPDGTFTLASPYDVVVSEPEDDPLLARGESDVEEDAG